MTYRNRHRTKGHMKNIFLITALLSASLLAPTSYPDSTIGTIEFSNCKIADASGENRYKAECALFEVPEDYSNPEGTKIELYIARFKSKNDKDRGDAMTLLAGGPGQGAVDAFAPSIRLLNKINTDQDIYLIDQRGTGDSNQMQCQENNDLLGADFDPEEIIQYTKECLEQLPGDAQFYTTSVAMRDLDNVRLALGLEQWNIYGGSYGTRTALHYLRQYPDSTRTVIIDAVVPPTKSLGPEIALESQRALDELLSRCAEDEDCHAAFPNLSEEVNSLMAELKTESRTVSIENIATGKLEEMEFTHAHLAVGIRLALYSPYTLSTLPTMLHEAAANDHYGPIARQSISMMRRMGDMLSIGMHNSVVCTEDVPFFDNENIDRSALEATYMGVENVDMLQTMCSVWPTGPIDEDFKTPVVSDKPVLILSGTADPITPPSYGEQAAESLSNSLHIILKGQGHIQLNTGCMPTIVAKFVEAASVEGLEATCLDKLKPDPFFIDFNGPTP